MNDGTLLQGRHALVYDIHTTKETWEWVDLKQVSFNGMTFFPSVIFFAFFLIICGPNFMHVAFKFLEES